MNVWSRLKSILVFLLAVFVRARWADAAAVAGRRGPLTSTRVCLWAGPPRPGRTRSSTARSSRLRRLGEGPEVHRQVHVAGRFQGAGRDLGSGRTAANARMAAHDPKAVFYIGEYNSGASEISIPILNRAGVPQVSPASTYVGSTTNEPGSLPGEPDKYYPTRRRTFLRIVPRDTIQAAALIDLMANDGCGKIAMANDRMPTGVGSRGYRARGARTRGDCRLRYGDRYDRRELSLLRPADQSARRGLLHVRRHDLQGRRHSSKTSMRRFPQPASMAATASARAPSPILPSTASGDDRTAVQVYAARFERRGLFRRPAVPFRLPGGLRGFASRPIRHLRV